MPGGSGLPTGTTRQLTQTPESEYNARWTESGKIVFLKVVDGEAQMFEMAAEGGETRQLTAIPEGINDFELGKDDAVIFGKTVKMDATVNELYEDLPDAEARIIDDLMYRHWNQWDDYSYNHVFVMDYPKDGMVKDGYRDLMKGERVDSPVPPFGGSEQYTYTADGTGIVYAAKKTKDKVEWAKSTNTDLYHVNLADGKTTNKKYPTLLYCQGGPQSTVSQFFSYRWNFQLMAAQGYIVVAPNRRCLPSFGEEWNEAISGDWGGQPMRDYLAAIDDVSTEKYVDKDKLGAVGASYGGYSVYYLAGIHEGRFKSFISHCGLFNLESWYGSTEEMFFANFDIKGPYWESPQPKSYEQFSPHKFVQNWDTPILVIHGENDKICPPQLTKDVMSKTRTQKGCRGLVVNEIFPHEESPLFSSISHHDVL